MCKRIALVCLSTQIINKIFLYFGVDLIAFYNCLSITYIGILYPFIRCHPVLWVGHNEFENVSLLSQPAYCYIYLIQTNSCTLFKTHSHLKHKIVKNVCKTYMFRSQLFDYLQGPSFMLSAVTTSLFASSSCLFGMWLYVVYVCACLMCLSVGCLVVNNQISHRQVHQARTHIDNLQPRTK